MTENNSGGKGRTIDNEKVGENPVSRRNILRTVGGSAGIAVGIGTLSGSASAAECGASDDREVVFCGCSQVCWCVPDCNVVVVHTDEKSFAFTDGNVALEPEGGPYETEFCYEVGDELDLETDGEKILGLEVFQTDGKGNGRDSWEEVFIFENPNRCADNADVDLRARVQERLANGKDDIEVTVEDGKLPRDVPGGCGTPPCKRKAGGQGRQANGSGNGR